MPKKKSITKIHFIFKWGQNINLYLTDRQINNNLTYDKTANQLDPAWSK